MKKYILIGLAVLVAIVLVISLFSTGLPLGKVIITDSTGSVTLRGQEAMAFRMFFAFRFYRYGIGGCAFNDGVSISIGNRQFALATDGCQCVKDISNGPCVEFSNEDWQELSSLISQAYQAD